MSRTEKHPSTWIVPDRSRSNERRWKHAYKVAYTRACIAGPVEQLSPSVTRLSALCSIDGSRMRYLAMCTRLNTRCTGCSPRFPGGSDENAVSKLISPLLGKFWRSFRLKISMISIKSQRSAEAFFIKHVGLATCNDDTKNWSFREDAWFLENEKKTCLRS